MRIELKGVEDIKKAERYQLNKIINSYYDKIKRQLKQDFTLKIKVHEYQTTGKGKKEEGKARKFSIQVQITGSLRKIEASASDWDLNRTMHAVLKKIIEEIEHQFHVSEQGRE